MSGAGFLDFGNTVSPFNPTITNLGHFHVGHKISDEATCLRSSCPWHSIHAAALLRPSSYEVLVFYRLAVCKCCLCPTADLDYFVSLHT